MNDHSNISSQIDAIDSLIKKVEEAPIRPKWTFTQWALLAVLILIAAAWVWGFIHNIFSTKISNIEITDVRIVGSSDLCPGDSLVIAFYLKADGTGKLVEDATVWVEIPPKTVIYSNSLPFLVDGTLDQEQTVAWPIPETYLDPTTAGKKPLPPGNYKRIFAIGSETDEDEFALDRVLFSIREDCGN